ncbi:MAG TPA: DMT family transporter [Devosiaceae bacterium]|nr:DMT family transporter [Devosiaceae bacterium]
MLKIVALTTVAMLAFGANSVLARLALEAGDIDALGYTGVRLLSGAIVLAALLVGRNLGKGAGFALGGSWLGAASLLGYGLMFSLAYLLLGAGTGALILFACVQIGMLAWAVFRGDRPGLVEWVGLFIAFAALVYLVAPGLVAPNPVGAALMAGAGLCWAAYSLIGRGSRSPLTDTAGNFIRCLPVAVVLILAGGFSHVPSSRGLLYAVASGALASGLGYAIWYAVLPDLSRVRAALVQLTVPAIAALGGVLFIGEPLTGRLLLASAGIIGGVALAVLAAERRRSAARRAI